MTALPAADGPTEVRTFLIADVRGYTRFTHEHGDEAAARLAGRFADIVEECVRRHAGEVVELRGDEVLAVFRSPRGALRASLDIQQRLGVERARDSSLPLLAGIGLDAGEAVPVKGGFRGGALNLAARLCSLAGPGEVLASQGVALLARKVEGIRYVDRGEEALKGLVEPVHAFRIVSTAEDDLAAPPAPGGFRVQLLGTFMLTLDGAEIPTASWQPRARTLFALLASAPQLRRSRDEIIDFLWPDATPDAAASNLRYTVHVLRRAFGLDPSPIATGAGWIGLNPAYAWTVDIQRFEALVQATATTAALEEAAALYRGEPLLEHRYDDWAAPLRARLERMWRELCLRLATTHQEEGAPAAAIAWYERLLEADPLDEEVLRALLPLLTDAGRHADALRLYARFEARLRQELDLEPAPETAALVAGLRARRPAEPVHSLPAPPPEPTADVLPSYALPVTGPVRGRDAELARLRTVLGSPGGAGPRLLLIAAEAGMGKTRLLAEAAQLARTNGRLVLAGGAYEEEGRLPWGPIHDALWDYIRAQPEPLLRARLGDLLSPLAQIVPELRTVLPALPDAPAGDPDAQRLRLFSTVAQTLERIASDRPLLLILDDLHWADEVTLQVLHFLVRQPGLQRVLILSALRSDEVLQGSPLAALLSKAGDAGLVEALQPAPLSQDEMTSLLEDRLAGPCAAGLALDVHRRAAGNPFFALQIVGLLQQEGGLRIDAGAWETAPGTRVDLPPAVRETVGRRLRHISGDARSILAFGAVFGREFAYAPLEAMSDTGEDALFAALDEAQGAGLLREVQEGYAFTHPLLWEVVYDRIPDQRRRRLHGRAGGTLESMDAGSPEELAWHFVESGNRERALTYTLLAAERAEKTVAHTEAERYFRQALDLARALGDAERLAQALEGLGGVLRVEAKLEEAIECLDEAAQIRRTLGDLDAEAQAVAQMALAWYFHLPPGPSEGQRRVETMMQRLEVRDGATPSLALAQVAAALPRLLQHNPAEELVAARRAAELGRAVGDPSLEAAGYLRQGSAQLELSQLEAALEALSSAIALADDLGDLFTLAAACTFAGRAAARLGRGSLAFELGTRAFRSAEQRGGLEQMTGVLDSSFLRAFQAGEWDLARDIAVRAIALHRSLRGEVTIPQPFCLLAYVAVHRGEWDSAERHLKHAHDLLPPDAQSSVARELTFLRATAALLRGRISEALAWAAPVSVSEDHGEWDFNLARATVLAAAGDPGAESAARAVLNMLSRWRHDVGTAEATHVLGLALAAQGNTTAARDAFDQAARLAAAIPLPYTEARALYECGRILGDGGRRSDTRERLSAALATFRRLQARPYIERAERALEGME